jgi:3-methyladenine DNA glycosylase AlkD
VLKQLKRHGSQRIIDGMARYGIPSTRAMGVPMGTIKALGKRLGKDHALAQALWASGWYEARSLAAFVDDPREVTLRQMTAWAADFDNWAVCDTLCFSLFDKSPFAWRKVPQWAGAKPEFVKRAGFALMACLALHDKTAPDKAFLAFLPLIEKGARDDRNFVKKAVNWALRAIGGRNVALHAAAIVVAERLVETDAGASRWVGKDALKQLAGSALRARLARQSRK